MADSTTELLNERAKTHGSFAVHARVTQGLKNVVRLASTKTFAAEHAEAIDMILHKIGRIVAGNANFKDHWDDIAGYARLASEACVEPDTRGRVDKPQASILPGGIIHVTKP